MATSEQSPCSRVGVLPGQALGKLPAPASAQDAWGQPGHTVGPCGRPASSEQAWKLGKERAGWRVAGGFHAPTPPNARPDALFRAQPGRPDTAALEG